MKLKLTNLLLFTTLLLSAQNLEEYRWKNRLIVITDYSADASSLAKQLALLNQDNSGLKERKLLIYQVTNKGTYQGVDVPKEWENAILLPSMIKRKSKQSPFSVYLIGLDGGIKMEKDSLVSLTTIFSLIDGMPMRRAELKKGIKRG